MLTIKPGQQVLAAALPLPLTSLDLLKQVVERLYGTGDTLLDMRGDSIRVIAPEAGFGPRVIDEDEFELPAPDPGEALLRKIKVSNGELIVSLEEAEAEVGEYLAAQTAWFNLVGGVNYVETSLAVPGEDPEFTVIMQKNGRPTPHELRQEAQRRENALREQLRTVLDLLERGDTDTAADRVRAALGE